MFEKYCHLDWIGEGQDFLFLVVNFVRGFYCFKSVLLFDVPTSRYEKLSK